MVILVEGKYSNEYKYFYYIKENVAQVSYINYRVVIYEDATTSVYDTNDYDDLSITITKDDYMEHLVKGQDHITGGIFSYIQKDVEQAVYCNHTLIVFYTDGTSSVYDSDLCEKLHVIITEAEGRKEVNRMNINIVAIFPTQSASALQYMIELHDFAIREESKKMSLSSIIDEIAVVYGSSSKALEHSLARLLNKAKKLGTLEKMLVSAGLEDVDPQNVTLSTLVTIFRIVDKEKERV